METISAAEYQAMFAKKSDAPKNKYGAKKVESAGMTFDSEKESKRYVTLKLEENSGIITNLCRQVKFKLIGCNYFADFTYFHYEKKAFIVEDVKSTITKKLPAYRIKKKQMKELYDIDILET